MIVTSYMGVLIEVSIEGLFSADVNGVRVEDKVISKVKTAIRDAAPVITLLESSKHPRRRWQIEPMHATHIAGDKVYRPTKPYYGTESLPMANVFEYDQAAVEKAAEIDRIEAETIEQVRRGFDDDREYLVSTLTPITTERFLELMAEARAARAAGK